MAWTYMTFDMGGNLPPMRCIANDGAPRDLVAVPIEMPDGGFATEMRLLTPEEAAAILASTPPVADALGQEAS